MRKSYNIGNERGALAMQQGSNRHELDYIRIGDALGGVQDWLPSWKMNRGGCAAVTTCDLCIYLARQKDFPALYPFDLENLTKEDFIRFTDVMEPYLGPGPRGVDSLEMYLTGLEGYWRSVGYNGLRVEGLSATAPYEEAEALVRTQVDAGLPVPYMLGRHWDSAFEDFEWHWFNLAGYEETPASLLVKAVTYGKGHWLNLRRLWDTGAEPRGGLIRLS